MPNLSIGRTRVPLQLPRPDRHHLEYTNRSVTDITSGVAQGPRRNDRIRRPIGAYRVHIHEQPVDAHGANPSVVCVKKLIFNVQQVW